MRKAVLSVVVLAVVFAAGCRKELAPSAEPLGPTTRAAPSTAASETAPSTAAGETAATPTSAAVTDEEFFKRFVDAMQRQIEADARAGAARKFASRAEALRFLATLTPAGLHPRREFFAGLMPDAGDPSALVQRMLAYAKAHPEEARPRLRAFIMRVGPLVVPVRNNIQKQFPVRWLTDPKQALRKAKAEGRAVLLVFCADWAGACKDLDENLADPRVRLVLDRRFVEARVDPTNRNSHSPSAGAYQVSGVPELVVLDKSGHVVTRYTGAVGVDSLLSLLAGAKKK